MDRRTRNATAAFVALVLTGLMAACSLPSEVNADCGTSSNTADTATFAVGDSLFLDCDVTEVR